MALTKAQLAENLISVLGLHRIEAKEFVDLFFEEIQNALLQGEEVKLSGFGNFVVRKKKPRLGRNPKTGETVPINARDVIVFYPGQKLRKDVDQGNKARESE